MTADLTADDCGCTPRPLVLGLLVGSVRGATDPLLGAAAVGTAVDVISNLPPEAGWDDEPHGPKRRADDHAPVPTLQAIAEANHARVVAVRSARARDLLAARRLAAEMRGDS